MSVINECIKVKISGGSRGDTDINIEQHLDYKTKDKR